MVHRFLKKFEVRRQSGFTLIELLVVVAILGILAVAVTPKVLSSIRNANTQAAVTSATQLQLALERYATENGDYPQTISSYSQLASLLSSYINLPQTESNNNWRFKSYSYAGNNNPAGYTLIIQDTNQTPVQISITPGLIAKP